MSTETPAPDTLLARLRDPAPDGPLATLADLLVDDVLARPITELIDPADLAAETRAVLRAFLASDRAHGFVLALLDAGAGALRDHEGALRDLAPPEALEATRALAGQPFSPDRALVLAVLDREPVRRLLRELLVHSLVAFGKKLRLPAAETGLAKSLGGLSRLAAEQVKGSALGALASNMKSAFTGEFERQVEQRSSEFADSALSGVLQQLADRICDPTQAAEQAALRTAILDGVLDLTGPALADAATRADLPRGAATVRTALATWAEGDRCQEDVRKLVTLLLSRVGPFPLRGLLELLEILPPVRAAARAALLRRLRPAVEGDAFARWLTRLLDAGTP